MICEDLNTLARINQTFQKLRIEVIIKSRKYDELIKRKRGYSKYASKLAVDFNKLVEYKTSTLDNSAKNDFS